MRWLLTPWGSRGDLHPFLALGQGLLRRGHEVALFGRDDWKIETEASGLRLISSREQASDHILQHYPKILTNEPASLQLMVKHIIEPGLASVCDNLLHVAPEFDVMVAQQHMFPAGVVAELTGIPWATITLTPGMVPSTHTPLAGEYRPMGNGRIHRWVNASMWSLGRFGVGWTLDPCVNRLRRKYGLKPIRDVLYGALSRRLKLQLYSEHFAPRPADWTDEMRYGGFCFYDPPTTQHLPAQVEDFLAQGEPPILFTLGTTAVHSPRLFYQSALSALEKLGLRGILLLGRRENCPARIPPSVLALDYAPFSLLIPRVRAVFHQCGMGTLSHVLRAGRPSVACPYAFDQPNNGRRLEALGAAEFLDLRQRTPDHFQRALEKVLKGNAPARAAQLGELLRSEDGVGLACAELERTFMATNPSPARGATLP